VLTASDAALSDSLKGGTLKKRRGNQSRGMPTRDRSRDKKTVLPREKIIEMSARVPGPNALGEARFAGIDGGKSGGKGRQDWSVVENSNESSHHLKKGPVRQCSNFAKNVKTEFVVNECTPGLLVSLRTADRYGNIFTTAYGGRGGGGSVTVLRAGGFLQYPGKGRGKKRNLRRVRDKTIMGLH